jgi:phosphoglycerate dehydrogenase-like enzyme
VTSLLIVLTMPEELVARFRDPLRAAFPEVEVNAVDGRDKIGPYIDRTDIILTFGTMMNDEVFRRARHLQWIQVLGTGVDRIADSAVLAPEVVITNIPGAHGPPVAEAALTAMLALARQLPRTLRAQERRLWERFAVRLLDGKTAAVLGVGVIATALAPRLQAMGMRVVGISSAPRAVPGFAEIRPRAALNEAVRDCDFLVILTPHTPATHHIVDESVLGALKPGCCVINLARGGVVEEGALIRALEGGALGGAALDVFATEPLPQDHPFWAMKNVIITPHMGGFYEEYPEHVLTVVSENLRRFLAGDRAHMINRVSRTAAPPHA